MTRIAASLLALVALVPLVACGSDPATSPVGADGGTEAPAPVDPSSPVDGTGAVDGTGSVEVPGTDVEGVTGEWVEVAGGPLSPRSQALGAWTGSEVVLVGGEPEAWCPPGADCTGPDFAALTDGAAYDPVTGAWRAISPAPVSITANASVAVVEGALYVLVPEWTDRPGGEGGFLRYDIGRDAWDELTPPESDQRSWYRLAALGDTVVAYGGSDERGVVTDLVLDPSAGTWRPLPDDPLSPSFDRLMVAVGGDLILFARDLVPNPGSEEPALARTARYDPDAGTWELLADSEILGAWSAVVIGSTVYVPESGSADGGEVNNWGRSYPYGGAYDTTSDTWSTLPAPAAEDGFPIAGVVGNGEPGAGYVAASGHVLRADTGEWITLPLLPGEVERDPTQGGWDGTTGRTVVTAGTDLFVFGGERWSDDGATLLDDAFVWTPPT